VKVLLNCESVRHPLTGIGHYARQLMLGLIERRDCDLYGFSHAKITHYTNARQVDVGSTSAGIRRSSNVRRIVRKIPGAYTARNKLVEYNFRRHVRRYCNDAIYHEPNYILRPFDGVSISTVHDLSWIHFPQYHPRERVRFMEREFPKTLKRADHFIAVSEYVKKEMTDVLGLKAENITTVHQGVSADFHPRTPGELEPTLKHYRLDYKEYLLAVATLEPRKNLEALLDAYMRLPAKERARLPLVLVGGKGWCSSALEQRVETLEQGGHIRKLGYVPDADLPGIYAGAHSFAFPSYYEGFGLPPLEAMASGVPVLVADNSAMSEVVAHAGIKVDAHDDEALLSGLKHLLFAEEQRTAMVESGLERARQFSWAKCVDNTFNVYTRMQMDL
jgi:alpha-1,3-rhamnosyl/mannosyltransferase